jgi:DNA-binding FadR family transcriptional regulator
MRQDVSASLNRQSLSSQIAAQIIHRINDGEFLPDDTLPSELTLAQEYRVSRPVVREALKELNAQGFVKVVSGKGAVVQAINDTLLQLFFSRALTSEPESWMHLTDVRSVLESYSARLAASQRDSAQLERLREVLQRMHANRDDFDHYSGADAEFHIEIARITGNDFLYYLTKSIRGPLIFIMSTLRHRLETDYLEKVHALHEEIFDAIERGDPDDAEHAMKRHFDDVRARIPTEIQGERDGTQT